MSNIEREIWSLIRTYAACRIDCTWFDGDEVVKRLKEAENKLSDALREALNATGSAS